MRVRVRVHVRACVYHTFESGLYGAVGHDLSLNSSHTRGDGVGLRALVDRGGPAKKK